MTTSGSDSIKHMMMFSTPTMASKVRLGNFWLTAKRNGEVVRSPRMIQVDENQHQLLRDLQFNFLYSPESEGSSLDDNLLNLVFDGDVVFTFNLTDGHYDGGRDFVFLNDALELSFVAGDAKTFRDEWEGYLYLSNPHLKIHAPPASESASGTTPPEDTAPPDEPSSPP